MIEIQGTALILGKADPRKIDEAIHQTDPFYSLIFCGKGGRVTIYCHPGGEEWLREVAVLLEGGQGCIN